ncbi:MAG: transglutaminase-like domain-containing protein [Rhizomicrobium sp.]
MPLPLEIAGFYTRQHCMTDPGERDALLKDAPTDIPGIVAYIQNLLLHQHWAPAYRMRLNEARIAETHTRSVPGMLALLHSHDPRPLAFVRTLYQRMVGNCRHFSILGVSLFRRAGIPARARCGFARYFDAKMEVDHWVIEYWNGDAWQFVDAQLDAAQRAMLRLEFDPLDVPRAQFLIAGEAWRQIRAGKADASRFGIMDMKGEWFVAGNVLRDFASLNGIEMLPWDVWGFMPQPGEAIAPARAELFDKLAALTANPDANFAELRQLYAAAPMLAVPTEVFNAVRQRKEVV